MNFTMKNLSLKKSNDLYLSTKKTQQSTNHFITSQTSNTKASTQPNLKLNSNLNSISKSTNLKNQRYSKISSLNSQQTKLKLNVSNETNITNFYQQKKRIHLNNDSFDNQHQDSPNKKRKMQDNTNPIIGWNTPNTNLECKISIDSTMNTTNQSSDSNSNLKEQQIDQFLDKFHKLKFNSLTKTPVKDANKVNSDLDGKNKNQLLFNLF